MLQSGDHHYRAFVGPPDQYDVMGATQFALLCALGLREGHRVLDIGCGSLRGGRLLITYLAPGGYTGLEPNRWLVEEGIETQLGQDALALKEPTFLYNDTFDVSELDPFDFVIAQSIATHTGPQMTRALFSSVSRALAPGGLAAITFAQWQRDAVTEGWVYPGCVGYRQRTIAGWLRDAGLHGTPLPWFHPRLRWWVIAHEGTPLPPRQMRRRALGATLSLRGSWSLRVRLRRLLLKGPKRARRRLARWRAR